MNIVSNIYFKEELEEEELEEEDYDDCVNQYV